MFIAAPLRVLVVAMALLLVTLIASSTAHGLVLGEAAAQSALGAPLRVLIPITAAPGESLQPGCFRFLPTAGDGSAQIVPASVSLERGAPVPRLVVTTAKAVNEPAIRFSIQAGCDGSVRRAYVLLLDPPVAGARTAPAVAQATAREPRQEAPQPATARRGSAGPAQAQVVQAPAPAARGPAAPVATPEPSLRDRVPMSGAIVSAAFHQVAGTPALPAAATALPRPQPTANDGSSLWTYVAAAFAVLGVIALAALFVHRRQMPPEVPQWTRNPALAGPRSFSDLSAAPVTLPHTLSRAGMTTTPGASKGKPKPAATSPRVAEAAPSRPRSAAVDPSTIDTLLDELDPDIVEERAVREAWAAARSDVERELDGNAILQAIEAAERAMQLVPPVPAQSEIERALDDDLLRPPRR